MSILVQAQRFLRSILRKVLRLLSHPQTRAMILGAVGGAVVVALLSIYAIGLENTVRCAVIVAFIVIFLVDPNLNRFPSHAGIFMLVWSVLSFCYDITCFRLPLSQWNVGMFMVAFSFRGHWHGDWLQIVFGVLLGAWCVPVRDVLPEVIHSVWWNVPQVGFVVLFIKLRGFGPPSYKHVPTETGTRCNRWIRVASSELPKVSKQTTQDASLIFRWEPPEAGHGKETFTLSEALHADLGSYFSEASWFTANLWVNFKRGKRIHACFVLGVEASNGKCVTIRFDWGAEGVCWVVVWKGRRPSSGFPRTGYVDDKNEDLYGTNACLMSRTFSRHVFSQLLTKSAEVASMGNRDFMWTEVPVYPGEHNCYIYCVSVASVWYKATLLNMIWSNVILRPDMWIPLAMIYWRLLLVPACLALASIYAPIVWLPVSIFISALLLTMLSPEALEHALMGLNLLVTPVLRNGLGKLHYYQTKGYLVWMMTCAIHLPWKAMDKKVDEVGGTKELVLSVLDSVSFLLSVGNLVMLSHYSIGHISWLALWLATVVAPVIWYTVPALARLR